MKHINIRKTRNWKKIVGSFLLLTLMLSIAYIIVKIIISPSGTGTGSYNKVKSDYVLMLLQCVLGLIVMMIPSVIERRFSINIPNRMIVMYFVFLYCAIYLGEVRNFFYTIPNWDTILHAFSGAMLGALGFSLATTLNDAEKVKFDLSPFFISLFAFCFALAMGAVWEIYEFTVDGLLSTNMQKFALANGTKLIGHNALSDTMKDIIVDALSALAVSVIGFNSIKQKFACKKKCATPKGAKR